jgi:hypothetical protein
MERQAIMTEQVFYHERVFESRSRNHEVYAQLSRLDKLLGRSSEDDADEARSEAAIDTDRVDAASSRVMGVYGDIGPTVPDTHSPDDDR